MSAGFNKIVSRRDLATCDCASSATVLCVAGFHLSHPGLKHCGTQNESARQQTDRLIAAGEDSHDDIE